MKAINKNAFSNFSLDGRNALITGASGLLGRKHAEALCMSGANVVLTDLDLNKLKELKKSLDNKNYIGEVSTYIMDVSIEDSIINTLNLLKNREINIDILVNNAAINPTASSIEKDIRITRLENFSLERWNKEIMVGLSGAFLCSKVFGSDMALRKKGVILNIASDLSVIAPDQSLYKQKGLPDHLQAVKPITYSVIKTGLIGLTRYLSSYWADQGVRANALSPGGVFANQDQEFVKRIESIIPMGRMANPDEYISAIQFLCSDASAYMNGQNIVMDGGRSVI
tara:strand:- start:30439 stop:31287 length:849 start_codon:yes stop_codon:yes gene_type:complete